MERQAAEKKKKYNLTEEDIRQGETTPVASSKEKIWRYEAYKERRERGENKTQILYILEGNQGWNSGQPKPYMTTGKNTGY